MRIPDLPDDAFIAALVQGNRLDALGPERFVFYPGMLFASRDKWWGRPGHRHARHEGIDLCFLETGSGEGFRLDSEVFVPMAGEANVVHIMDDFLGRTVIASRAVAEAEGRELLTVYAHIRPEEGLCVGDRIADGRMFARIAPVENPRIPLPAHLHISMAWADQLPERRHWSWKLFNQLSSGCFLDPLKWMAIPCKLLPFCSAVQPAALFPPARSAPARIPAEQPAEPPGEKP